ncbi:MAG: hypothetical protein LBO66_13465 [Deltaproteobacteria bacterium]|nr:hypothetical protein [Deltaproteobacteria bacterium]
MPRGQGLYWKLEERKRRALGWRKKQKRKRFRSRESDRNKYYTTKAHVGKKEVKKTPTALTNPPRFQRGSLAHGRGG